MQLRSSLAGEGGWDQRARGGEEEDEEGDWWEWTGIYPSATTSFWQDISNHHGCIYNAVPKDIGLWIYISEKQRDRERERDRYIYIYQNYDRDVCPHSLWVLCSCHLKIPQASIKVPRMSAHRVLEGPAGRRSWCWSCWFLWPRPWWWWGFRWRGGWSCWSGYPFQPSWC